MNIKTIFFDVDGTLLDSTTHIMPKSTLKALQLLKLKGIKLGIATGRSYDMLFDHELYLDLFDAFICNNGMSIHSNSGKIILQHSIDPYCVEQLISEANSNNISISLETNDGVYNINEHNKYIRHAFDYFKAPLPPIYSYKSEPIIMAVAYNFIGYDWHSFGKSVNLQPLTSASTHCDLLNKNISKHSAIQELLQLWNLSNQEFMCFGDQMNDYDMIKNATYGIAVKDPLGSKELQSITALHAEAPCNDGIYKYLVDINLI